MISGRVCNLLQTDRQTETHRQQTLPLLLLFTTWSSASCSCPVVAAVSERLPHSMLKAQVSPRTRKQLTPCCCSCCFLSFFFNFFFWFLDREALDCAGRDRCDRIGGSLAEIQTCTMIVPCCCMHWAGPC